LMLSRVRATGVGSHHVAMSEVGRAGLYFFEPGAAPRASAIVYDRAGSSMAMLTPGSIDWHAVLAGARWFHITGITPALSAATAAESLTAVRTAKSLGLSVSIDVNYRSKLWTPEQAGRVLHEMLAHTDLLVASEHDTATLFGITGDFANAAAAMAKQYPIQCMATTRREARFVRTDRLSAIAWHRGETFEADAIDVEVVDRVGSGDAFTAGMIHGILIDDWRSGLKIGLAMSAIKHTISGDMPVMTESEIESAVNSGSIRIRR
jgi:2-dehydro-3-deoxygluconokinase